MFGVNPLKELKSWKKETLLFVFYIYDFQLRVFFESSWKIYAADRNEQKLSLFKKKKTTP